MKTNTDSTTSKPKTQEIAHTSLGGKDERGLVQVRLTPKATQNLQKLVQTTGISNRTQLVNAAIDLAADVISTIQKGGTVVYEQADGTRERLKLIGV